MYKIYPSDNSSTGLYVLEFFTKSEKENEEKAHSNDDIIPPDNQIFEEVESINKEFEQSLMNISQDGNIKMEIPEASDRAFKELESNINQNRRNINQFKQVLELNSMPSKIQNLIKLYTVTLLLIMSVAGTPFLKL